MFMNYFGLKDDIDLVCEAIAKPYLEYIEEIVEWATDVTYVYNFSNLVFEKMIVFEEDVLDDSYNINWDYFYNILPLLIEFKFENSKEGGISEEKFKELHERTKAMGDYSEFKDKHLNDSIGEIAGKLVEIFGTSSFKIPKNIPDALSQSFYSKSFETQDGPVRVELLMKGKFNLKTSTMSLPGMTAAGYSKDYDKVLINIHPNDKGMYAWSNYLTKNLKHELIHHHQNTTGKYFPGRKQRDNVSQWDNVDRYASSPDELKKQHEIFKKKHALDDEEFITKISDIAHEVEEGISEEGWDSDQIQGYLKDHFYIQQWKEKSPLKFKKAMKELYKEFNL
jgi:hypothetical protein